MEKRKIGIGTELYVQKHNEIHPHTS